MSSKSPTRGSFVRRTVGAALSLFMIIATFATPFADAQEVLTPSIRSEFPDYAPGATVKLIGEGWQPAESVHIYVDDSLNKAWTHDSNPDPVADGNGYFEYSFSIAANFVATYTVIATGALSGQVSTTFTDAIQKDLEQWANGDTPKFQTGSLNDQNSAYPEGGVVPFRMKFTEIAAYTAPGSGILKTTPAVIQHDVTGGPAVTYDFLASYDAYTDANLCDGAPSANPFCANSSPGSLPTPDDSVVWPDFSSAEQLAPGFPTLTVGGAVTASGLSSSDRELRGWGVDITGITGPTYSGAITSRKADFTISFQIKNPATNPKCTAQTGQNAGQYLCTVVFAWGGHLADSNYWDLAASGGVASGAASNPGADFHMRLQSVDGDSTGQRDRSMQSGAITAPPGLTTLASDDVVSINSPVTDTAHLTGILQPFTTSDSVNFFICGPSSSAPDCSTGGTPVGGSIPVTPGGETSAPFTGSATSAQFTPTAPGTYCFRAEFDPGNNSLYDATSHTDLTDECFTVGKNTTTVSTQVKDTKKTADKGDDTSILDSSPNVAIGTVAYDTATLGSASSDAGGTVTYKLYKSAGDGGTTCDTLVAAFDGDGQEVVTVTNGSVPDSSTFTFNAAGTYEWVAVYSGDANNKDATSACG